MMFLLAIILQYLLTDKLVLEKLLQCSDPIGMIIFNIKIRWPAFTILTEASNRKTEKGRPYGKPSASPHSDVKRPEKSKETKRPESKEKQTGKLSVFTWSHAEFLIQAHKLDPSRLLVLDMNALEGLMRITVEVEKEEENTEE